MKSEIAILTLGAFITAYGLDTYNWTLDPQSNKEPQSAPMIIAATSATASFTTMFTNTTSGEEIQQPTFPSQTSGLMIRS